MKKLISAVLLFSLLFTMISFVSAENVKPTSADNNQGTIITEVTEDEYVQIVSQHSDLSVDKMKEKLKEYKEKITKKSTSAEPSSVTSASSGLLYYTAITTKDFSSGTALSTPVELGMAYTVYYYDNWRQVNSIDSVWTGASASGAYTWSEYTKYTYPSSFPASSIEAHARGAVETQIDISISGSAELKQALLGIGFSVTAQIGTIYYLRKVDNIDEYVNLY